MKCCPSVEHIDGTCISFDNLKTMAKHYNENKKNNDTINLKLSKADMVIEFEKRFGKKHNKWIENSVFKHLSDDVVDTLTNLTFRHDGPQGQFTWLSTVDLEQVLNQYTLKYPDFKFIGAFPIDFAELTNLPINNINFDEMLKKNIIRYGVIFNTDPHYKGGAHWISLYFDLKKKQIYFSDSVGNEPDKEIQQYINKIDEYIKKKNKSQKQHGGNDFTEDVVDIRYNTTKHQRGNSECGVFSINWILRLLSGKTFEHITKKRLSDEKVNKCRNVYFNK